MRPFRSGAPLTALSSLLLLSFGIGCSEAVLSLGTLPLGTSADSPCKNATRQSDGTTDRSRCAPATSTNDASAEASGALVDGGFPGSGGRTSSANDGGSGAGAASSGTIADACAAKRAPAERRALNLLLLVDDSLSVVLQPVWNSLTAAISRFVDDPTNTFLGVGIEYYGLTCSAADYENPVVPIRPLPGNAANIKSSYPLPINGKAIVPAMHGAFAYLRSVLVSQPERDAVLVLVTDGVLDPLCGSTAASAANEATLGTRGTPSMKTFVIALGAGPTLLNPAGIVDLTPLDTIAAEGGTTKAARVEVNASTNAELTLALDSVAKLGAPCAYAIPKGIDAMRAELEWQPASGQGKVRWARVSDGSACQDRPGVYEADSPGFLALCPSSCSALQASPAGSVWAVELCASP